MRSLINKKDKNYKYLGQTNDVIQNKETTTKEVIRYVKEYVTRDSIRIDSVPCENGMAETKTIYETKWKTIHDTIQTTRETTKINPVNIMLQDQVRDLNEDNVKLKARTKTQRKTILSLILVLAGGGLVLFVYAKIKKFV